MTRSERAPAARRKSARPGGSSAICQVLAKPGGSAAESLTPLRTLPLPDARLGIKTSSIPDFPPNRAPGGSRSGAKRLLRGARGRGAASAEPTRGKKRGLAPISRLFFPQKSLWKCLNLFPSLFIEDIYRRKELIVLWGEETAALSKFRIQTLPSSCNFNEGFGTRLSWSETSSSLSAPPAPRDPKSNQPRSAGPGWDPTLPGRSWIQVEPPCGEFGAVPGRFWQGKPQRRSPHRDGSRRFQAWHQHSLVSAPDPSPSFSSLPVDSLPADASGIRAFRRQEKDGKKAGIGFLGRPGAQPKEKPKVGSPSPAVSKTAFG